MTSKLKSVTSTQAGAKIENYAAVSSLSRAFSEAIDAAVSTGAPVTMLCNTAAKYYRGAAVPAPDAQAIIANVIAAHPKWQAGSQKVRKSEMLSVLNAYSKLPEAVTKFCKQSQSFTYHHAIGLSRRLKTMSVTAAVDDMVNRGENSGPKSPKDAKKKAAISIKRLLAMPKLERAFKVKLAALAAEFSLNVGTVK